MHAINFVILRLTVFLFSEKKPVFRRANTAVDPQAVQRASVRTQYAAMTRLKATRKLICIKIRISLMDVSTGLS